MRFQISIAIIVLLPLAGCIGNDDKPVMTDADLQNEIEVRVNSDSQLGSSNLSISADAALNKATISGTVESDEFRARAVDLAKSAHDGLVVEDSITVKPRELTRAEFTPEHARLERERAKEFKDRIGDSTDDAWIHAIIVMRLTADASPQGPRINVDVTNGVVTLRGTVDSSNQKAEAERISRQTEGVKRVNNVLKVSNASSARDPDEPFDV